MSPIYQRDPNFIEANISLNKLPTNSTNFGFLMSVIKNYLSDLSYGLYLIQNKNCGAKYYYKLGININNDVEFRRFIAKFINS